jgi:hypothetical protein
MSTRSLPALFCVARGGDAHEEPTVFIESRVHINTTRSDFSFERRGCVAAFDSTKIQLRSAERRRGRRENHGTRRNQASEEWGLHIWGQWRRTDNSITKNG